jgi:hypothetical protein
VTVPQTGSVAVPTLGAVTLTAGQSVFMFCSTNTAGGQYTIKNLRLVLTRVGALTTAAGEPRRRGGRSRDRLPCPATPS